MNAYMDQPFPKSITSAEKCRRLMEVVNTEDVLGIFINADPDAMASAMALKRLFWRKARKVVIYHINPIQRADNLAFIKLLRIDMNHIRHMKTKEITKRAMVDSQPHHYEEFNSMEFDIIIDHHPLGKATKAPFLDIKQDYGACSTVMVEYLRAAGIRPSSTLASALFYGIKTDTDNFVRASLPNDINAFRYLYKFINMNMIKKIESSEMTKKTLTSYKRAMDKLTFIRDIAFVHMGEVDNPDILVIIADFFMRLAETSWSIVSGIHQKKLIVILRNAGFRGNAGKRAQKLLGRWEGSAGGHKSAARAEILLSSIVGEMKHGSDLEQLIQKTVKNLR